MTVGIEESDDNDLEEAVLSRAFETKQAQADEINRRGRLTDYCRRSLKPATLRIERRRNHLARRCGSQSSKS